MHTSQRNRMSKEVAEKLIYVKANGSDCEEEGEERDTKVALTLCD